MAEITVVPDSASSGYWVKMLVEPIKQHIIDSLMETLPKAVAERYVQDHMQEIMDKINANEVVTLIAAAVAQKIADAYKPKQADDTVIS